MGKLIILDHPLISHKLSIIRDKNTSTSDFKRLINEVGALMTYEIARDLSLKEVEVETPICKTVCKQLDKPIVIVPILRAGLGMMDGIHSLIPTAKIGFVGLYRDEVTKEPQEYYTKFPQDIKGATVFVVDPMLATGGSASRAIDICKKRGASSIRYIGLVGVDRGIKKVQEEHPDVDIYLAAKDDYLNDDCYIVPGLGDCGDRIFGTK